MKGHKVREDVTSVGMSEKSSVIDGGQAEDSGIPVESPAVNGNCMVT